MSEKITLNKLEEHFSEKYGLPTDNCELLAKQFCETFRECISDIEKAVEVGDGKALHGMSHKLKGALLNSGLEELAECAKLMEGFSVESQAQEVNRELDIIKNSLQELV